MQQVPFPTPADETQRDSRVLVFSQRNLARPLWHVTQFEFEDVIGAVDDVVQIAPGPGPRPGIDLVKRRVANRMASRLHRRRPYVLSHIPNAERTPVTGDHDLFVTVFHYLFQVPYLRQLPGWRERSRRAACLVVETWQSDLTDCADWIDDLRRFDVVYLLNPAVAARLRERGIDARFLPTGVDALAFSPLPTVPRRVLHCYNYGRRSEVTHAALVELVEREGLTYLYDTTTKSVVRDPAEHRRLIANNMKRAEFFFAYTLNDSGDRAADVEQNISTRYFEGAAGGAVMLGSRPRLREFDEYFDWPDAVVPLPFEAHDIGDVIADLRRQPERLARIRYDNVRNSLLRHDWSERWRVVLADNGLDPSERHQRRRVELQSQASLLTPELLGGELARERPGHPSPLARLRRAASVSPDPAGFPAG